MFRKPVAAGVVLLRGCEMRHAFWLLPLGVAVVAVATCAPPATVRTQSADNSYCLACHTRYKSEKLATRHADAGVSCTKCHGASQDHCRDKDNITPPDIMYSHERIVEACMECHPGNLLARKEIHQEGRQAGKACTDCHGSHRLAHRTRRWNKATGDLIEADGARVPIAGGTRRGARTPGNTHL